MAVTTFPATRTLSLASMQILETVDKLVFTIHTLQQVIIY
ncbi:hypothetical protein HMPREF0497_2560 [Lentilactobacillus buchneri ATCC 11577]|nr:hypothetical protein HMPREF0497_2560 [Lentilactobacillus buchneri ATCC 11577]